MPGAKTTYFGRVTEVSHAAAMYKLHEHLANLKTVSKIVVDVQAGVDHRVRTADRRRNRALLAAADADSSGPMGDSAGQSTERGGSPGIGQG